MPSALRSKAPPLMSKRSSCSMPFVTLMTLVLALGSLGCLPPPKWTHPPLDGSDRAFRASEFQPEAGQCVLYVFPQLNPMTLGRMPVFIDGIECGYTTSKTYLRIVVPPGEREVRTAGTFRGFWGREWREAPAVRLVVEPGSIHYLQQSFNPDATTSGPWIGDNLYLKEWPSEVAKSNINKLALGLATDPGKLVDVRTPVPAAPPVLGAVLNPQGHWESDVDLGSARIRLVQIPAGTFPMGNSALVLHGDWYNGYDAFTNDDERPVHFVTLSAPFWIGKFDVTQGQYQAIMGLNPSYFREAGSEAPVERVTWEDCREFLARLNALQPQWTFRLPAEAEWEFACRGGHVRAHGVGSGEIHARKDR